MHISCTNCGAEIPSKNVNINRMVATCARCNAVFSFADQISGGDEPASNKPLDIPTPKGWKIESTGYELILRQPWLNPQIGFLTFFTVLWNGFMLAWFGIALATGSWGMLGCGTIHAAIGMLLAYLVLTSYINSTVITISPYLVKVRYGPLPWFGNKQIDATGLKQLYVKEQRHEGEDSVSYTYDVHYITTDYKHEKLIGGLQQSEFARYIEQEIERYLGIKDQQVPGEF